MAHAGAKFIVKTAPTRRTIAASLGEIWGAVVGAVDHVAAA
jgi:hypothetical protein